MDQDPAGLNDSEEQQDPAGALVPASPRLASLKHDAQLLLDELARRVNWVRRLPGKTRREVRQHRGQLIYLLAGGAALTGAGLAVLVRRWRREERPLNRAVRKMKLLGGLIAHPENVVHPPIRVTVGHSILATALSTLAGEMIRRLFHRLGPPGGGRRRLPAP